jgi:meso-butanediol dehydrogenase/(S,S)-butanediol dehydrogenase/diacetyl reductase
MAAIPLGHLRLGCVARGARRRGAKTVVTAQQPGRLAGKVVLLTGIGGGQGRAASLLFAREGALIVGCDIDEVSCAETVRLVQAEGLAITSMAPIDLADPAAARAWVTDAGAIHGRIDVLYNNASRPVFAPFPEMSVDDYNFTVANEIDLVWHACQAAWKHLVRSGGVILNIASIAGLIGTRDLPQAAHVVTKGAIISLTRQLAAEGVACGIRANSISPGVIASPPIQAELDRLGDDAPFMSMVRTTARGEPGRPEDIAYAALYLVSDEARFVNGENLVVDGGATVIVG